MRSLRQKTYGVFIRPYIDYGGDRITWRGNVMILHPCQQSTAQCPSYVAAKDGSAWMLYKNEYLTSFALVRERVKEIMDDLGISRHDIHVAEVIPIDNIVTPLS